MPRTRFDEDEYEGSPDDDRDAPLEADWEEDDEESDTRPCPKCRRDVYDEADQCPYCGTYMVQELSAASNRSTLFIVTAIVAIGIVVFWVVFLRPGGS